MTDAATVPDVTIVPADQASWDDVDAVLGTARCHGVMCHCQRYKRLDLAGLVAYLENEPVGWCSVGPRAAYARLWGGRVPWGRPEVGPDDDRTWAITCFITRAGYRRRGITYALARGAVEYARERGAKALEGYPMVAQPGFEITWGELHVGSHSTFAAAGFAEVSRPTLRRAVMRIDLESVVSVY